MRLYDAPLRQKEGDVSVPTGVGAHSIGVRALSKRVELTFKSDLQL